MAAGLKGRIDMKNRGVEAVAVALVILGALVALAGYRFGLLGSLFAGLAILVAGTRDRTRTRRWNILDHP